LRITASHRKVRLRLG